MAAALGRKLAAADGAGLGETPGPTPYRPLLVVVGTAELGAVAQIAQLLASGAHHIHVPAHLLIDHGGPHPLATPPDGITIVSIDAVNRIEPGLVERTVRRGHEAMVRAGVDAPVIGVCGINPHAGENGLFGYGEEESKIVPAVEAVRADGIDARGPIPADTAFFLVGRGDYDLIVVMYTAVRWRCPRTPRPHCDSAPARPSRPNAPSPAGPPGSWLSGWRSLPPASSPQLPAQPAR